MSLLWSGPGRALQVHLDTFAKAAQVESFISANDGKAVTLGEVPERLNGWLHFARSYSGTAREARDLVEGMTNAAQQDLTIPINSRTNVGFANTMALTEYHLLDEAVTHYVSMDMMNLVTNAAQYAVPEPLFPTDIPCPAGLIVFEHPLIVPDLHPVTGVVDPRIELPIRGFGWLVKDILKADRTTIKGIVMVAYIDIDSYEAFYSSSLERIRQEDGAGWVEAAGDHGHIDAKTLTVVEFNPWGFGTVWSDAGDDINTVVVEARDIVSTVSFQRRWMLSFFRLIWQEILAPEPYSPTRAERRRVDRFPFTQRREADVKVLKLRRIAQDVEREHEERESGWTLDHRIVVRPHWRRQYYRSLGEVGDPNAYRLVWIQAFIKGPEGTPLVIKHNVTSVTR